MKWDFDPEELRNWYQRVLCRPIRWGGLNRWNGSCRSPFRPDRHPSFSVTCNPERAGWHDFGTGEHGGLRSLALRLGVDPPWKERSILHSRVIPPSQDHMEAQRHLQQERLRRCWNDAEPLKGPHPYLLRKCLGVPPGVLQSREDLLVPLWQNEGVLGGIQTISPQGAKRFLPGTSLRGSWFGFDQPWDQGDEEYTLAEGLSTAASLRQITGGVVLSAFSAGQIPYLAHRIRNLHPRACIWCASDNDPAGWKAVEDCRGIGVLPLVPSEPKGTDWNDRHRHLGLAYARREVDQQKKEALRAA